MWQPDIFQFVDYRAYLRAYYDAAKQNRKGFSYRSFAKDAGLSSQSFLRDVIRGDKNIGSSAPAFCDALKLTKSERSFFMLLVTFDQAANREEKNLLFEQIAARKRFREARHLDVGMYRYLSHWYYPTIREMIARDDFRNDPAWIARQLEPPVKKRDVERALETLIELGFVSEENGELVLNDPTITTGHEATSLGVVNYHLKMMSLASESMDRFPFQHRDIAAMTVCIKKDQIETVKKKIHKMREEILDFCDREEGGEIVMQFNSQLFPLNKIDS